MVSCSSILNRALSTFPKMLFLGGLNMKRVIFLLACSIGISGLLSASLLIGEQQVSSADNVSPHSSKLNVAFLPVTFPYTSTEVHL